jgi:hypothetical protein
VSSGGIGGGGGGGAICCCGGGGGGGAICCGGGPPSSASIRAWTAGPRVAQAMSTGPFLRRGKPHFHTLQAGALY